MITDEEILEKAPDSYSISDLMKKFGLQPEGSNHRSFKKRVLKLGLTFKPRPISSISTIKRPVTDYLFKDGPAIGASNLRKKLVKAGLKNNKCEICQIVEWCGKTLNFHLDHIDGDNTNNELTNLRILCPNCHSQTDTYGKLKTMSSNFTLTTDENGCIKKLRIIQRCNNCVKPLYKKSVHGLCADCFCRFNVLNIANINNTKHRCNNCNGPISSKTKTGLCIKCWKRPRKAERPSYEQLLLDLSETSCVQVAKKYGVSDKAIAKWLIAYQK